VQRARRTRFLFFHAEDRGFIDVARLLRGEAKAVSILQLHAISILAANEIPLTESDLDALFAIPSNDWVDVNATPTVRMFAENGLVVTDDPDPSLRAFYDRDELLTTGAWNIYTALYHSMTRWRGVDVELNETTQVPESLLEEVAEDTVTRFGLPPSHFHSVDRPLSIRELPLVSGNGSLYGALTARRTTRLFAPGSHLTEQQLAQVLLHAFGCHGYLPVGAGVVALHRTSPSGGGLHPIEVYPLLISVEGYDAGLYHYNVERHALEQLERLDPEQAAALADAFTCGQFYFRGASVLFLLTARFERTFWKYRHERAYAVVLFDAAHLSQTFQLVCADLGLGSFVTSAVNVADVDARLGVDGFSGGALALVGCGVRSSEASFLNPEFAPYTPRETEL
jgi:putative peptide maturation dehydrogenase